MTDNKMFEGWVPAEIVPPLTIRVVRKLTGDPGLLDEANPIIVPLLGGGGG